MKLKSFLFSSLTERHQESIAVGLKDDSTIISNENDCSCSTYIKRKRKWKDYVIDVYSIRYLAYIYVSWLYLWCCIILFYYSIKFYSKEIVIQFDFAM